MAIIVDKAQKKKDIALACKRLLVEHNINTLSIAQLAKEAGIGKGTFYEYFDNKDALVFELVTILMQKHNEVKKKKIEEASTTKEKIKLFYAFFYNEEDAELRALYQDFIAISLTAPAEERKQFQTECFDYYYRWAEAIIDEGIDNKEIIPESKKLVKGLFAVGEGMFISSVATHSIGNLEEEINAYIDVVFDLIKREESA